MTTRSSSSSAQLARQLGFARAMRSEPTPSERTLWEALLSARRGFRRQAVVAACIVDILARSRVSSSRWTAATTAARHSAGLTRAATTTLSALATASYGSPPSSCAATCTPR
ncbi:MAG: DUF559 domain-containing protein [Myxococcales bacterium]|nr:MAG: DUF559 domain-containing protein [Myxococcales bacterium]